MSRLGQILAATAFVAAGGACENPPPQESLRDTRGATTMVIPANADVDVRAPKEITSCDGLGEYVREDIERLFLRIRIGNSDTASAIRQIGDQAREECEAGEMRADCRAVMEHVRWEILRDLMEGGISGTGIAANRAGKVAEKECLAGYGLAPEEEEVFASRSPDRDLLDPGKIW